MVKFKITKKEISSQGYTDKIEGIATLGNCSIKFFWNFHTNGLVITKNDKIISPKKCPSKIIDLISIEVTKAVMG